MKFSSGLLLAAAGVATAQVSYDNSTNTWSCPIANGSYCAGDSLSSNSIILCTDGVGYEAVCDGHVQDRPPIDVYYAPCWQQSPDAGNATCSKNCTVWPDNGNPFSVPGECQFQQPSNYSYEAGWDLDSGDSGASNSTNSTGPYHNSTATSTVHSPTLTPTASGSGGPATATTNAAALLNMPAVGTSVFGAGLLAVAAFAL